jgi:long-chain fatty acid transport protein
MMAARENHQTHYIAIRKNHKHNAKKWGFGAAVFAAMLLSGTSAFATQGYFNLGYGPQSQGMAGVSYAYPKDSMAIASNPASALLLGDRVDFGLNYFRPSRSSSITGNYYGPDESYNGNGQRNYYSPEAGFTHALGHDWAIGVSVTKNGNMSSSYAVNPFGRFGATGSVEFDLKQYMISPTVAYRIADGQSIGLSPFLVHQTFRAAGVGMFSAFSESPNAVSGRGADHALAYGLRIGWLGQITPWLSMGASWQSKAHAQHFDKYKGLMADQGGFDLPSTFGLGIAVKASENLDIAADIQRIEMHHVGAIGDDFQRLLTGALLGSSGGAGFGCNDLTTYKLGVNYRLSPAWQLRAGYAYVTQAFPKSQAFFHILAPDTVSHQLSLGGTWSSASGVEISAYGFYAPKNTLNGEGSIPAAFGGGEAHVSLSEIAFGLGAGKSF